MEGTVETLPLSARQLTPRQAAQVLTAVANGTFFSLGFPADELNTLIELLTPVRQNDVDGNLAVPLDVLYTDGTIVEAVDACR